jgi:hypothetical protein
MLPVLICVSSYKDKKSYALISADERAQDARFELIMMGLGEGVLHSHSLKLQERAARSSDSVSLGDGFQKQYPLG